MAKRTDNFNKFVKKPKGSAIKEQIRQDKKKEKKERAAAIEAHFARKREERMLQRQSEELQRPAKGKFSKPTEQAPKGRFNKAAAPAGKKEQQPGKPARGKFSKAEKPFTPREKTAEQPEPIVAKGKFSKQKPGTSKGKFHKNETSERSPAKPVEERQQRNTPAAPVYQYITKTTAKPADEKMPLNKFIAHSGVCARRDAAELVKSGKVTVNGSVETNPAVKVSEADAVKVNGKTVRPSRNFVYILLNKPKDYITTVEDPQGRKTVLDLIRAATPERVYPVGRLDRNTSGVLLLTNDGDLAQKLSHPKHEIKKIYEVRLDRPLTKADMDKIAGGITLEDGFIAPDTIAYADAKDKSIIGIEIHSGRNRIVRRIFEHMKYDVKGLDRVMFAGLTKKDVQRGKWRFLKEKEVRLLKYMNQSFVKTKQMV